MNKQTLEDILKKHLGKHYEWHHVGDWGNLIVDAMEEAYEEAVKEHNQSHLHSFFRGYADSRKRNYP